VSRKAKGPSSEPVLQPITGGLLDWGLLIAAAGVVVLVGLLFQLNVNRVFDVPKALALKVGGCGIFLIWLLYGLFGKGWPWRSIRVFFAPVAAMTGAIILSTLLSIDRTMSLNGVYERQFGLQGFLGCIGLFVVTATCLRSRRGAFAALGVLALVGGAIGTYSFLQAIGMDPFGFFSKPHNKTYSFLGNATFAGNALALIFPMSAVIAITAWAKTVLAPSSTTELKAPERWIAFGAGVVLISGLQIVPGLILTKLYGGGKDYTETWFTLWMSISLLLPLIAALGGSWGPGWSRFGSAAIRRGLDALAAGMLSSAVLGILFGIACTRTRGAWVGSAIAIFFGAILLPNLFASSPREKKLVQIATLSLLGFVLFGGVGFSIAFPNHIWTNTIKSIPKAFDPQREVVGRGQGTRPYLWLESPRVLFNHGATLERLYEDERERSAAIHADRIKDLELDDSARSPSAQATDRAWRKIAVWFTGIGIETYRYAFMSHKSKKLESLDPMTNHDNPHNNYLYVLASFGILGFAAYLWLLWRLLSVAFRRFAQSNDDLVARTVAFGVVTSFFSYAVYSIAGFDSVACSVFFYFFLGAAAVYFDPSHDEPRRNILVHIKRQWAAFRGRDEGAVDNKAPIWGQALLAIAGIVLLGILSIGGALDVYSAEVAFVGKPKRDLLTKIEDIKKAIRKNPYESYYKQSLGGAYIDASRQRRQQAQRLAQGGQNAEALAAKKQADEFSEKAETALYAALDHAWAPENVFISLFQLYYSWGRYEEAEHALERALQHSPHLGAVRANLAVLKLERRAYDEALKDCKWVLEVDPASVVALRTCGRAAYFLNQLPDARTYLTRAAAAAPNDNVLKGYLEDLKKAETGSVSR
jgi:tetratricopeptide (TPR) repeat protein